MKTNFSPFLGWLPVALVLSANLALASEDPKPAADSRYSNWEFIADADGVKTFRRDAEDGAVGFRGEILMNIPMEKIATLLADMESRKKWMDEVVEAKRIRMNSLFDRVEYNHTAVPWPFQNRDFVYSAKVDLDKATRTMIITMKSVEDPENPPKSGIVRGKMLESRYYLHETEKGKTTFMTVEIMVDPMGAIPKWLARLKQKKWPRNTLTGLRKYLEKNDVVVPAEFKLMDK
ncbi:MAG: hypothetical protein KGP28_09970 [Bdellovibrionales bacterium]|nr:hypothetical protein [Bdellovibrionales bacterium]